MTMISHKDGHGFVILIFGWDSLEICLTMSQIHYESYTGSRKHQCGKDLEKIVTGCGDTEDVQNED